MIHLVILALTGSCNLACTYCYASNQAKTFMKKETIDALISRLVEERNESMKAPPLTVQLTGGEPLLAFRQISYLVRRMEEAGLHASFQLQTNATLMTPAIASFIKKHHIAAGVSLDGVPEVNDLTRPEQGGGGSSLKTLRGIRILAEAGVEIGVTCVVSRYNAAHLDALVDLCFYMGNVRKIGFNLLRPQGRGTKEAKAEAMAAVKGISRAILHARKMETLTGRTMIISQMEKCGKLEAGYQPFSHCYAWHDNGMYVDPEGYIYACASLSGQERFRLGNVSGGVEPEKAEALRRKLETVVNYCSRCRYLEECGGACYSRADEWGAVDETECAVRKACIHLYEMNHPEKEAARGGHSVGIKGDRE